MKSYGRDMGRHDLWHFYSAMCMLNEIVPSYMLNSEGNVKLGPGILYRRLFAHTS